MLNVMEIINEGALIGAHPHPYRVTKGLFHFPDVVGLKEFREIVVLFLS